MARRKQAPRRPSMLPPVLSNGTRYSADYLWVMCSHKGCNAKRTHRHETGQPHIGRTGWFDQKTGERWCPQHHPEWVASWRARQKEIKGR